MKCLILFLSIILSLSSYAQNVTSDSEIIKEVNETLWKPFKKAWETNDSELFNSLHTADVFRVNSWGIKVGEEYKESNAKSMTGTPSDTRKINFALESRIYSGDQGYEVGYYKITNGNSEYYARFHVRLRKEDGKWRISQDWDTNNINGVKVTAEDYNKNNQLGLE